MREQNYCIMLKNGKTFNVTREEDHNKSAIGLWKWSFKQQAEIVIDFNEFSIVASSIIIMEAIQ